MDVSGLAWFIGDVLLAESWPLRRRISRPTRASLISRGSTDVRALPPKGAAAAAAAAGWDDGDGEGGSVKEKKSRVQLSNRYNQTNS